jgi:hypothetical protein
MSDNFAEWSVYQMENDSGLGLSGGIKSLGHPHAHVAPGTAIILPGRASLALRYCCELPSQRDRNLAAIGADYFLIQDSPGYQGMLDTGTAALNLTWEGWLHTGVNVTIAFVGKVSHDLIIS